MASQIYLVAYLAPVLFENDEVASETSDKIGGGRGGGGDAPGGRDNARARLRSTVRFLPDRYAYFCDAQRALLCLGLFNGEPLREQCFARASLATPGTEETPCNRRSAWIVCFNPGVLAPQCLTYEYFGSEEPVAAGEENIYGGASLFRRASAAWPDFETAYSIAAKFRDTPSVRGRHDGVETADQDGIGGRGRDVVFKDNMGVAPCGAPLLRISVFCSTLRGRLSSHSDIKETSLCGSLPLSLSLSAAIDVVDNCLSEGRSYFSCSVPFYRKFGTDPHLYINNAATCVVVPDETLSFGKEIVSSDGVRPSSSVFATVSKKSRLEHADDDDDDDTGDSLLKFSVCPAIGAHVGVRDCHTWTLAACTRILLTTPSSSVGQQTWTVKVAGNAPFFVCEASSHTFSRTRPDLEAASERRRHRADNYNAEPGLSAASILALSLALRHYWTLQNNWTAAPPAFLDVEPYRELLALHSQFDDHCDDRCDENRCDSIADDCVDGDVYDDESQMY